MEYSVAISPRHGSKIERIDCYTRKVKMEGLSASLQSDILRCTLKENDREISRLRKREYKIQYDAWLYRVVKKNEKKANEKDMELLYIRSTIIKMTETQGDIIKMMGTLRNS